MRAGGCRHEALQTDINKNHQCKYADIDEYTVCMCIEDIISIKMTKTMKALSSQLKTTLFTMVGIK
jgi:hypothetical protein